MGASIRNIVCCAGLQLLMAAASCAAVAQAVDDGAHSTFGELQQLMQNQAIHELRTSYHGNYGASLLFRKDERSYYVVLFQDKKFWRVVKTAAEGQAEQIYQRFTAHSERLAEVENRRIRLEADEQYMERQIAAEQVRLTALQNTLAIQQQQERTVRAEQQLLLEQTQAMSAEAQSAKRTLRNLQNRIRSLEQWQSKLDNGDDGGARFDK